MAIIHSHRAGIEYLEHCALRAADDRLVFVKSRDAVDAHFSIPGLNTAAILLGPGTSMTQAAARFCAEAGILVAFAGGGGTPLYLASIGEYREPAYSRNWIAMWEDEPARLKAAKQFQLRRIELITKHWKSLDGVTPDPSAATHAFLTALPRCADTADLLAAEGLLTKSLYAELSRACKTAFTRKPKTADFANEFLDMGNYLAYGLAACTLWVLGIPFSYPLVHGKTRRGALVFDLADVVKDALVMPNAFIAATKGESESKARHRILCALQSADALTQLFRVVQEQISER